MLVKKLLIYVPILISAILIQSYLWIPTYEEQTKGNPERLREFITSSIGDASILNPILAADSASAEINSLVFEGLLDRDEELNFRGRLARSWKIYEEAYFYISDGDPYGVLRKLEDAKDRKIVSGKGLNRVLDEIENISLTPSQIRKLRYKKKEFVFRLPPRIHLILRKVDQDLFIDLEKLLGEGYFKRFDPLSYLIRKADLKDKEKGFIRASIPPFEHNPVIVFSLREGVKFHDGHLFDAWDVKFTYDAIMDPKNLSPRISDFEPIKGIEVIDPYKIKIIYKRLYSPALSTWTMGILPEHLLNREALKEEAKRRGRDLDNFSLRDSSFNRHPIGCGPFRFVEWKSDQYIVLERFEHYWEGPPNYHRYIYRIIPDPLTQEMEFYAGTIDSYPVQPHQVERLKRDPRFQSFSGLSFGYTYIGYNMRREPFNDKRVRKALGMAIDVDKIIRYVLYGQAERITGPFVKQTDYYNKKIAPLPYDPEGALRLLQEAGWHRDKDGWLRKDGKKLQFTLITNSGNEIRKAILAIAQDAWKKLGIDVRTDVLEWSVFIKERVNKLDFDALILGWSMGIEPDLYQIFHSSQCGPYQLNFVGFKNQEADELILRIRREYDHQKQVELCHRLHEIIAEEQPYTFLYVTKWTAVLDKRIVIKDIDRNGKVVYKKITPTKSGDYTFYFNKWIKLPEAPVFSKEG